MRMIKFNRNLFIVAILLSNSCSDFLSDSNNSIALIPFKLNNQWEYADTKYDSSGNIWLADNIASNSPKTASSGLCICSSSLFDDKKFLAIN